MPGQRHVPSTLGWRSHKSLQAEALLAALLVFCVGLLYLKAQSLRHTQSQTARVIQPQTPASSVCTGTVAGEWRPTQSTDGRLTISVHGGSARGVYLFEGRRRTLTGKVTPAGLSGTWSEESTAVAPGDAGEFDAKFDPARHTLELFFLVGGDLGGRSTWSCTPDN